MALYYEFHIILYSCIFLAVSSQQDSNRQTTTGPVVGFRQTVYSRPVDTFYGIPFAKPPVGQLRFRPPQPIDPWTTAYNATTQPNCCYQEPFLKFSNFSGGQMWLINTKVSEDCLYLNVWQPVGGATKKAVMIWIYGGGFSTGSNTLDWYNGKYLAAEGDVIIMSMQSRVSVFGYGYLQERDGSGDYMRGNVGLLDQAMAIKWFYDNVEIFGGDRNRITIFGESSGAASVHYQLVSPMNKDIVTGAIMQSGSGGSTWAYDNTQIAVNKTLKLAKYAGCYNGELLPPAGSMLSDVNYNSKQIIDCMLELTADKLSKSHYDYSGPERKTVVSFAPTVDGHIVVEPPTAANFPAAVNNRQVMMGVNRNEGYYFLASDVTPLFPWNVENPPPLTETYYKQVVATLLYSDSELVQNAVAFEYGKPSVYSKELPNYRDILDDLVGDVIITCPELYNLEEYAKTTNKIFAYIYEHKSSANTFPDYMGAMHGYEIDSVFGIPLGNNSIYSEDEKVLSRNVIRYWTNFAKNGDPSVNDDGSKTSDIWPRYDPTDRQYFVINTTNFYTESGYRYRGCSYWKEVVPSLREAAAKEADCSRSAASSQFLISSEILVLLILLSTMSLTNN